ncbi:MAG TPA: hypothetical protein VN838_00605 [Bradyrhizobium sp.]|nr:hypothetical protein [Bradyrhizobium sp.]
MAVTLEIFADLRAEGLLAGALPDVTSGQLRQLHIQPNLRDN